MNEARDALKSSFKRRKEISIAKNDTCNKEIDTSMLFTDGNQSEFDAAIANLMEKNKHKKKKLEISNWSKNHKLY